MLHIHQFDLDNHLQSAYKPYHSTETALPTVQNDIFVAIKNHDCIALTLLRHDRWSVSTRQIEKVVWPWYRCTGVGSQLPETLFPVSQNLVHLVQSHQTHLWCQPGFGAWTISVNYVYYSSKPHNVKSQEYQTIYTLSTHRSTTRSTHPVLTNPIQNIQNSLQDWMYKNKLKLNLDKLLIGNTLIYCREL